MMNVEVLLGNCPNCKLRYCLFDLCSRYKKLRIMEKKIGENQIVSTSMLVEVISKPTGEKLVIVRGGSPQMPVTLFVGTPEEFSKFALTM